MKRGITELLDFIGTNEECQYCLSLAMETYFRDAAELLKVKTLEPIIAALGPEVWSQVYPGVLEFFFSNEYENPDGSRPWNVIDAFLERGGVSLTDDQTSYLRSLRQSSMSVYEVKAVDLDHSMTLVDLVEKKPPVVVLEKKMTHCVQPGDSLGLRVMKEGDHHILSGAGLRIIPALVEELINTIRFLHGTTVMMSSMGLGRSAKDKAEKAKNEQLSRVMWAPEIGAAHMRPYLELARRRKPGKAPRRKAKTVN